MKKKKLQKCNLITEQPPKSLLSQILVTDYSELIIKSITDLWQAVEERSLTTCINYSKWYSDLLAIIAVNNKKLQWSYRSKFCHKRNRSHYSPNISGNKHRSRKAKKNQHTIVIFPYPSVLTCVLGAQENRLIEMVLLSTHNMFCFRNRKNNLQIHTLIWGLIYNKIFLFLFYCFITQQTTPKTFYFTYTVQSLNKHLVLSLDITWSYNSQMFLQ